MMKQFGLLAGILLCVVIFLIPIPELSQNSQAYLALTLMTVVFWAFQAMQPGYAAGIYLVLLAVLRIATPAQIFSVWTSSTVYLVIGAYLIADAVHASGLGKRIAYAVITRYVRSYRDIILCIFTLTFLLGFLIPHPWPRAFLIMSVVRVLVESADIPKSDAAKLGFAVFAASVPISMILLTSDSTLAPMVVAAAGSAMGWVDWLWVMGLPALILTIITYVLFICLFKPSQPVNVNKEEMQAHLKEMGKLSALEIRTIIWLGIAILLWVTDKIHGIQIGWVTFGIAMLMGVPKIGGVLTPKVWNSVPVQVLFFLTAAIAMGQIGQITGCNQWIADNFIPAKLPENIYLLAAVITFIGIALHMLLGSVITVIALSVPIILTVTAPLHLNPIIPALIVYTAISGHYILPYQHLNILIGVGDENGLFNQRETVRLGLWMLPVIFFVTTFIEITWWKCIGLL